MLAETVTIDGGVAWILVIILLVLLIVYIARRL